MKKDNHKFHSVFQFIKNKNKYQKEETNQISL